MNREYMKLNDNNYMTTNDDGEIVITKSDSNIKEILMKENEIEDTYDDLFYKKDLLDIIKNKDKMRKDSNKTFIIIGIISAITGYFTPIGIVTMLATMIPGIFIFKLLFSLISGTKKSNRREIMALNSSIELDIQKIKKITEELEKLKTKNNYQTLSHSKTQIKPIELPTHEHNQNKVKRLVPNEE